MSGPYSTKSNFWVSGGLVDGSTIGGTTPAPGTFTTLTATSNALVQGDLTVSGKLFNSLAPNSNFADPYLYLDAGYTTVAAKTGGLAVNYLPTATKDLCTGTGVFTPGVASVSNPSVTVASSNLGAGDLIQVSGTLSNDGLYEVLSDAAGVLTINGVGTTATVTAFTQDQFQSETNTSAVITKVNVSIIRCGSSGLWQYQVGSTTSAFSSFINFATAASGVTFSTNSGVQGAVISLDSGSGTNVIQTTGLNIDGSNNLTLPATLAFSTASQNMTFNGVNTFPASSTTNAVPKWGSTTGRALASTGVQIDASNNLRMDSAPAGLVIHSSESLSPTGGANFNPSLTTDVTFLAQGTGANTGTLGNGTITGQRKVLALTSYTSGSYVLTITNGLFPGASAGSRTLTFDTAGQSMTLIWNGSNWMSVNGGAVVA